MKYKTFCDVSSWSRDRVVSFLEEKGYYIHLLSVGIREYKLPLCLGFDGMIGFCHKSWYLVQGYVEVSVEEFFEQKVEIMNTNDTNSNLLKDVKNLFESLDSDTFGNFCEDAQEEIMTFCKKYNIDTSDFCLDKEVMFNLTTEYIKVPGDMDMDDVEFILTAKLPDGTRVTIDVDGFEAEEA